MTQFSKDHKFSRRISKCFRDIGLYEFFNPVSSYPWANRNRIIARIRVFEKYLNVEDVVCARWHHFEKAKTLSKVELLVQRPGIEFLNKILDDRSGGNYTKEITAIEKSLPTVSEYIELEFGHLRENRVPFSPKLPLRLIDNKKQ